MTHASVNLCVRACLRACLRALYSNNGSQTMVRPRSRHPPPPLLARFQSLSPCGSRRLRTPPRGGRQIYLRFRPVFALNSCTYGFRWSECARARVRACIGRTQTDNVRGVRRCVRTCVRACRTLVHTPARKWRRTQLRTYKLVLIQLWMTLKLIF